MAISLNNHESRIKALESQGAGSYSETILFENLDGFQIGHNSSHTFTFSNLMSFQMLHFCLGQSNNQNTPNPKTICISDMFRTLDILAGADSTAGVQRSIWLEKLSNTQIKLTGYDTGIKVYRISGIKFSKVILYYFSNIIKSLKIIHSIIFTIVVRDKASKKKEV